MTINEFRAWLDGFSAAITDAPTPDQWEKVKAKIATVQNASVAPFFPNTFPNTSPSLPTYPRFGEVTCATSNTYGAN